MKHFFLALSIFISVSSIAATPQQRTVRLYQDQGLKIVCHATPENTTLLTRKKNTASIIFNGLANATANLASIIAGDSNKAKQQAALNIISTVCDVTAQLANKEKKNDQTQKSVALTSFSTTCTNLTNTLLHTLEEEAVIRKPLPQTLSLLKNIPEESRSAIIDLFLASSTHAYQFINELFSLAYDYLAACNEMFFTTLNDGVDDFSYLIDAPALL